MTRSTSSQGSQGETYTHDPYGLTYHSACPPSVPPPVAYEGSTMTPPEISMFQYQDVTPGSSIDNKEEEVCALFVTTIAVNAMNNVVSDLSVAAVTYPGKYLSLHTVVRSDPSSRLGAWVRGNSITNIVPGSPAEQAELKVGMRVLEISAVPLPCASVSSVIRTVWKDIGILSILVETPSGTRSKRSLAKARARQRVKQAKAEAKKQGHSSANPIQPNPGCVITPVVQVEQAPSGSHS
eukprot:TRINITY_DN895_c10_g1_i1.p1 TRINITY_DN895_c10_g1~~TRINITY_DN895_c10_g1_i1.p1  ORF type:complete len:258 (+),score=39.82 TRINITY_DN895_c10_g1_i1:63-776(+)